MRVIGLATAFYWIVRTATTVPLSRFMDRTDGERDEFYFVVAGTFIMSSMPLFYIFVSLPWHIYLIQAIMGLVNSMAVPGWRILFTDHLDKGKTGFEWSLEDIAIGISVGASAYLGSIIADKFGFKVVFVMLAMLGYVSTAILSTLKNEAKTLAQIKREKLLQTLQSKRDSSVPFKLDGTK